MTESDLFAITVSCHPVISPRRHPVELALKPAPKFFCLGVLHGISVFEGAAGGRGLEEQKKLVCRWFSVRRIKN